MDFSALILVPTIAGCAIVGFILALFAANAYLQVLQQSGAGARTIQWPGETIPDHIPKSLYVVWIFGLVFGPCFFVGKSIASSSGSTWLGGTVAWLGFWLIFPLCQLSSLGGPTPWLPFWPELFHRLRQKPSAVLAFYGFSIPVLGLFALAVYFTFGGASLVFMLPGVPLLVFGWVLYARVLGRLAFILSFTRAPLRKTKKLEDRPRKPAPTAEELEQADRRRVHQPSQQAPIETPSDGPLHGYDVRFVDEPPPPPPPPPVVAVPVEEPLEFIDDPEQEAIARAATEHRRKHLDESRRWDEEDDDTTPYIANEPEVKPEDVAPKELVQPNAELRLFQRDAPRKPKRFWNRDLLAFVLDTKTASTLALLGMQCLVLGGLVRLARAFAPGSG